MSDMAKAMHTGREWCWLAGWGLTSSTVRGLRGWLREVTQGTEAEWWPCLAKPRAFMGWCGWIEGLVEWAAGSSVEAWASSGSPFYEAEHGNHMWPAWSSRAVLGDISINAWLGLSLQLSSLWIVKFSLKNTQVFEYLITVCQEGISLYHCTIFPVGLSWTMMELQHTSYDLMLKPGQYWTPCCITHNLDQVWSCCKCSSDSSIVTE